jgi:hypothetical protein
MPEGNSAARAATNSAKEGDLQEDLVELFAKCHYRMIPVMDTGDHILALDMYNDIMKGAVTGAKD